MNFNINSFLRYTSDRLQALFLYQNHSRHSSRCPTPYPYHCNRHCRRPLESCAACSRLQHHFHTSISLSFLPSRKALPHPSRQEGLRCMTPSLLPHILHIRISTLSLISGPDLLHFSLLVPKQPPLHLPFLPLVQQQPPNSTTLLC